MAKVNVAPGQCRLNYTNSTTLTLARYQGAYLPIKLGSGWRASLIPEAGVTLANTGLTAATKYNIYAYDNAGTLTLEASTTAHATDADTGVEIKSGDATRTLVGLAYMGVGTPGTFLAQGLGTLSWFNRRRTVSAISFSTHSSLASGTYAESATGFRVSFVNWADDLPHAIYNTTGGVNGGADQWLALYIDGSTFLCEQYGGTGGAVFMRTHLGAYITTLTDETTHYVTLMQKESATQYVNGNQIESKMSTIAQVCVMG